MGVCEPPSTDFGATHAKFICHAVGTTFLTSTPNVCSPPKQHTVLGLELDIRACLHGFLPLFHDGEVVVEENMRTHLSKPMLEHPPAESVSWPPRKRVRLASRWSVYRAVQRMSSPACIALSSGIHAYKRRFIQAVSGSWPFAERGLLSRLRQPLLFSLCFDRRALKQPRSWCGAGVHVSYLGETCTVRLLDSQSSVVAIETDSGSPEN